MTCAAEGMAHEIAVLHAERALLEQKARILETYADIRDLQLRMLAAGSMDDVHAVLRAHVCLPSTHRFSKCANTVLPIPMYFESFMWGLRCGRAASACLRCCASPFSTNAVASPAEGMALADLDGTLSASVSCCRLLHDWAGFFRSVTNALLHLLPLPAALPLPDEEGYRALTLADMASMYRVHYLDKVRPLLHRMDADNVPAADKDAAAGEIGVLTRELFVAVQAVGYANYELLRRCAEQLH